MSTRMNSTRESVNALGFEDGEMISIRVIVEDGRVTFKSDMNDLGKEESLIAGVAVTALMMALYDWRDANGSRKGDTDTILGLIGYFTASMTEESGKLAANIIKANDVRRELE